MNKAIADVVKRVRDGDFESRKEATVDLALVLEKNTIRRSDMEPFMSPSLASTELNQEDVIEVISELISLIRSDTENRASLIWALGKANPNLAFMPFVSLLKEIFSELEEMSLFQTAIALDNFIRAQSSDLSKIGPDVDSILQKLLTSRSARAIELVSAVRSNLQDR